jgi:hypothetical protein
VLKNSADDHHWVRSKNVDQRVPPKLSNMVGADDRIIVAAPHVVYTRFELNHVVGVRSTFRYPVHPTDNATKREAAFCIPTRQLLEDVEHAILIEAAVAKIYFCVGPKLELPALPRRRGIDSYSSQPVQMVLALSGIDDVNRFVARFESALNEGEQDPILFFDTIEKCADMARFIKVGAGKGNGGCGLHREVLA